MKLRKQLFGATNPARNQWAVSSDEGGVTIEYQLGGKKILVDLRLKPGGAKHAGEGKVLLRSNAPDVTGEGEPETIVVARP